MKKLKIRTITFGLNQFRPNQSLEIAFKRIHSYSKFAKEFFAKLGFEIQSVRIATLPWQSWINDFEPEKQLKKLKKLDQLAKDLDFKFVSIGPCTTIKSAEIIPELISQTETLSASFALDKKTVFGPDSELEKVAKIITDLGNLKPKDLLNFRFGLLFNCPPNIPFFPAAYHEGETCFSLGFENSVLLKDAADFSETLEELEENYKSLQTQNYLIAEKLAEKLASLLKIPFLGIDCSFVPSLEEKESFIAPFNKMNDFPFGENGSLSFCGLITRSIKSLEVKKCGFNGLMLPVMEDVGLANAWSNGQLDLQKLISYSSVCACGLDTVPLPGDFQASSLVNVIRDLATISFNQNKPLAMRVFPINGKKSGDQTELNSPYLVNTKVL